MTEALAPFCRLKALGFKAPLEKTTAYPSPTQVAQILNRAIPLRRPRNLAVCKIKGLINLRMDKSATDILPVPNTGLMTPLLAATHLALLSNEFRHLFQLSF